MVTKKSLSASIEDYRTYVPVRFMTESLGDDVHFDTEMYDIPAVIIDSANAKENEEIDK